MSWQCYSQLLSLRSINQYVCASAVGPTTHARCLGGFRNPLPLSVLSVWQNVDMCDDSSSAVHAIQHFQKRWFASGNLLVFNLPQILPWGPCPPVGHGMGSQRGASRARIFAPGNDILQPGDWTQNLVKTKAHGGKMSEWLSWPSGSSATHEWAQHHHSHLHLTEPTIWRASYRLDSWWNIRELF